MKRAIFALLAIFLLAFIVVPEVTAQTATTDVDIVDLDGGRSVTWTVTLDSAETEWSNAFSVDEWDDFNQSDSSFALPYGVRYATADSINVTISHYVCYTTPGTNANWISADDIVTSTAATLVKSTVDFNYVKAPWHKLKVVNNAGGSATTVYYGEWWTYKGNE